MLTFAIESVTQCWNEVMILASQHWAGTKSYRRHQPFCPSFERYQACNEAGFFLLFTARDGKQLIGYFGVYLTPSMHSQLLMATEDVFFITPEYRKGWTAVRFIKFIEQECLQRGVVEIMFSCEAENEVANKLLKFLDYSPVIMQYSKYLIPIPRADSAQPSQTEAAADVGKP